MGTQDRDPRIEMQAPDTIAQPADAGFLLHQRKYSIRQAANAMGVGRTTLRRMIRSGQVPVLRVGHKTLLIERDVDRYLRGGYGTMRVAKSTRLRAKLSPLPADVMKSGLLAKVG